MPQDSAPQADADLVGSPGSLRERLEASGLACTGSTTTIDGPLLPLLACDGDGAAMRHRHRPLLARMSGGDAASRSTARAARSTRWPASSSTSTRPSSYGRCCSTGSASRPRRQDRQEPRAASTDAQTLEELADRTCDCARSCIEYRELAKLKGTYVDSLPRLVDPETGRVHTSYHPTGAATGRLSSSDPNLQNIPARTEAGRKIRTAFVPRTGHVFLACDYSQVELRVLAHLTGDPGLVAAFRAGEDIHRHTAAKVFDVLPDLVSDQMRRRAKAVNFGILYGMSEMRLAREQGMSRAEARKFIQAYFERFEKVRGYIDQVRERALRDGAVSTMFGRVRLFPQLKQNLNHNVREQALRGAVNTTIQGTAADLMKLAMLAVWHELKAASLKSGMLLQVHDELLLEVPQGEIEQISELVPRVMQDVHRLDVPLVVDRKIGKNWLEVT